MTVFLDELRKKLNAMNVPCMIPGHGVPKLLGHVGCMAWYRCPTCGREHQATEHPHRTHPMNTATVAKGGREALRDDWSDRLADWSLPNYSI